eukprot:TRINITY_DN37633_c0_g1_i1.p1 TRINITY_DN37633_c0_g1~~TRINITY_DN37633_c0_g1_i1.p1  ORF type:complete len:128 (+),score=9.89 TRINITY_DN37633_c0_g1_i1:53-385(+)
MRSQAFLVSVLVHFLEGPVGVVRQVSHHNVDVVREPHVSKHGPGCRRVLVPEISFVLETLLLVVLTVQNVDSLRHLVLNEVLQGFNGVFLSLGFGLIEVIQNVLRFGRDI